MLHPVLDTGTPERLNYYMNMQPKKKTQKMVTRVSLYVIVLNYHSLPVYMICPIMCEDAKFGHGQLRAEETIVAISKTLLETPSP